MKTKIKSMLLALTITVSSVPFSGITANAIDLSDSYTQEVDWDLWERFLKYDLRITDYEALTDEEKELCRFIFETERSAEDTIICERARRQLAGYDVGERVTLDVTENYYEIRDYSYSYSVQIDESIAEQYTSYEEFFDANYYEYRPDVPVYHCVPDIKHIDYNSNVNEYWLDDVGMERIFTLGEANGYVAEIYGESYGYFRYNEDTQEYDVS